MVNCSVTVFSRSRTKTVKATVKNISRALLIMPEESSKKTEKAVMMRKPMKNGL